MYLESGYVQEIINHRLYRFILSFCLCAQGIFISRVSEEGPAARAGVKVGDKLLVVKRFLFTFPLALLSSVL